MPATIGTTGFITGTTTGTTTGTITGITPRSTSTTRRSALTTNTEARGPG